MRVVGVKVRFRSEHIMDLQRANRLYLRDIRIIFVRVNVVSGVHGGSSTRSTRLNGRISGDHVLHRVGEGTGARVPQTLSRRAVWTTIIEGVPRHGGHAKVRHRVKRVLRVPRVCRRATTLEVFFRHFRGHVRLVVLTRLMTMDLSSNTIFPRPFVPRVTIPLLRGARVVKLFLPCPGSFFRQYLRYRGLNNRSQGLLFRVGLRGLIQRFVYQRPHTIVTWTPYIRCVLCGSGMLYVYPTRTPSLVFSVTGLFLLCRIVCKQHRRYSGAPG